MNSITEMGRPSAYRLAKSSRSSIRATVVAAVIRRTSSMSMGSSHSLLETNLGARPLKDAPELTQQAVGVPLDDLLGQPGPGLGLAARVPDARREVPHDEHRGVPGVLEVPELPEHDGPPERDRRRGRVQAQLHAEGAAELELGPEFFFRDHFGGARQQPIQLGSSHDRAEATSGIRNDRYHRRTVNGRRGSLVAGIVVLAVLAAACHVPRLSDEEAKVQELPQTSFMFAADGSLLTTFHAEENRVVVPLDQIPDIVKRAIVAVEDRRFYQHPGIDLRALVRAAYVNATRGRIVEGARRSPSSTSRTATWTRTRRSPGRSRRRSSPGRWSASSARTRS